MARPTISASLKKKLREEINRIEWELIEETLKEVSDLFRKITQEKIIFKKIKEKIETRRKTIDYSKLDKEEKVLVKVIEEAEGTIFQSDLVEKSGFDKVKVGFFN